MHTPVNAKGVPQALRRATPEAVLAGSGKAIAGALALATTTAQVGATSGVTAGADLPKKPKKRNSPPRKRAPNAKRRAATGAVAVSVGAGAALRKYNSDYMRHRDRDTMRGLVYKNHKPMTSKAINRKVVPGAVAHGIFRGAAAGSATNAAMRKRGYTKQRRDAKGRFA